MDLVEVVIIAHDYALFLAFWDILKMVGVLRLIISKLIVNEMPERFGLYFFSSLSLALGHFAPRTLAYYTVNLRERILKN